MDLPCAIVIRSSAVARPDYASVLGCRSRGWDRVVCCVCLPSFRDNYVVLILICSFIGLCKEPRAQALFR